jgi:hypothetical protein
MYLVEIEAGREQLYESVEALAAAIRASEIRPESRIFHRASSSWVPITVHPEYRKAVSARGAEPLPPLSRRQWTFFGTDPKEREIVEAAAATEPAQAGTEPRPARRGLRAILGRALRRQPSPSETPEHTSS